MLIQSLAIDQNIIQENKYKFSEKRLQNLIHNTLKSSWCISEAKGHDLEMIVPMVGLEGSFMLILSTHTNLMITSYHIQLGKIFGAHQFIQNLLYNRQREPILYSQAFSFL